MELISYPNYQNRTISEITIFGRVRLMKQLLRFADIAGDLSFELFDAFKFFLRAQVVLKEDFTEGLIINSRVKVEEMHL